MRMIGDWKRYGVNTEPYLENADKWVSTMASALQVLYKEILEAEERFGFNICLAHNAIEYMRDWWGNPNNYVVKHGFFGRLWVENFKELKDTIERFGGYLSEDTIQSKKGKCMPLTDFEKGDYRLRWVDIVREIGFDPYEYALNLNTKIYRSAVLAKALIFCIDKLLTAALRYNYGDLFFTEKTILAVAKGDFFTGTVSLNDTFYAKRRTLTSQCHAAMLYGIANGTYKERVGGLASFGGTVNCWDLAYTESTHSDSGKNYWESSYWIEFVTTNNAPGGVYTNRRNAFLASRPDTATGYKAAVDMVQLAGNKVYMTETARTRRVFFPDVHTTMGDFEKSITDFINSNIKTLTPTEDPVADDYEYREKIRLEMSNSRGLFSDYICNFTDLKTIDLDALTN